MNKNINLSERIEILEDNIIYEFPKKKLSDNKNMNPIYRNAVCKSDKWVKMAGKIALLSAKNNGGPFGAIILQICSSSNKIIRYWSNHNKVTQNNDPTAHAEINTIRQCCKDLGVFSLSKISKKKAKLPQPDHFSYCVIYSSCEPCPMCFSAIKWSRIDNLIFSATRFDAEIIDFSDDEIYQDISKNYAEKAINAKYAPDPSSLDAFNYWKESPDKIKY